jgi:hypothetical protein
MDDRAVWIVDQQTAADVIRDLELSVTESQTEHIVELLAEHRANTLDLGVSRVQSQISDAIQDILQRNSHKTSDWSDGCRSAEAAIYAAMADAIRGMKPIGPCAKKPILRA